MKHILFISRGMSYGGSGRCISAFTRNLVDAGFRVSLLILRDYDSEYYIDPRINEIRTHLKTNTIKVGKADMLTKWFPAIIKYCVVLKPDLIIPFGYDICLLTFIGNLNRSKICFTVRSNPKCEPSNIVFRFIRDICYHFAEYIWVQNEQQLQLLRWVRKSKIITVPNPVREEIRGQDFCYSGEMRKFINLGRLNKQKNQKMLIEVFEKLKCKYGNIVLEIYGEGVLKEELEKEIKKHHVEDIVFLKGRSEKALDVLKSADAFILSSIFEGMPNALMEAMALGVPCISTDCDTGPRDLIDNQVNGLLVPSEDKESLYQAIEYFINHIDVAESMGRKAKETIWSQYDEIEVTKLLIKAVERMCEGK